MWLIARYQTTSLFTLKPATATASGGKTLLVPTPYAIKMALLDVACRVAGADAAGQAWDQWLKRVGVALLPAPHIVVNNTFIKYLRERRNPAEVGSQDAGFFQRTITYREHAHIEGEFHLALETDVEHAESLAFWLLHINYLGRRGGFIQLLAAPESAAILPNDYIRLDQDMDGFALGAATVLMQLDDVGDDVSFQRVNIYSGEAIKLGTHRVLRHIALPYRRVRSSRSYTLYEKASS